MRDYYRRMLARRIFTSFTLPPRRYLSAAFAPSYGAMRHDTLITQRRAIHTDAAFYARVNIRLPRHALIYALLRATRHMMFFSMPLDTIPARCVTPLIDDARCLLYAHASGSAIADMFD